MLDRREKRILHFQQRPWRAHARLLLARCAELMPEEEPPPPPEPAEDEDESPPPPPPLPPGCKAWAELARGAVIAGRAECPALLLHACAQLRNVFDGLPAAVDNGMAYGPFEAMPRLSQADPPDPPPAIVPALWKPLARATEALLCLLGQLRDGAHPPEIRTRSARDPHEIRTRSARDPHEICTSSHPNLPRALPPTLPPNSPELSPQLSP